MGRFTTTAAVNFTDVLDHLSMHQRDAQLLAAFFVDDVFAATATATATATADTGWLLFGQFSEDFGARRLADSGLRLPWCGVGSLSGSLNSAVTP